MSNLPQYQNTLFGVSCGFYRKSCSVTSCTSICFNRFIQHYPHPNTLRMKWFAGLNVNVVYTWSRKSAFSSAASICRYWSRRWKQHAHPWRIECFCKQCHIFLKNTSVLLNWHSMILQLWAICECGNLGRQINILKSRLGDVYIIVQQLP